MKCKYCGKEFKKTHNRQVYCCKDCRRYARMEYKAEWIRKYRRSYKFKSKWIGTGHLGNHAVNDSCREMVIVTKECRRLKIKD